MANDLEKFLQQAAERLAQKMNSQNQASARPAQTPGASNRKNQTPPVTTRMLPRTSAANEIVEAEVINHQLSDRKNRELGPDPLSSIDTRPALAQVISQSDERMGSHIHQVFDHELSHLRVAPQSTAIPGQKNQTDIATEVKRWAQGTSPLIATLSNPASLRAAFIVGEIFRRPT